MINEAISSILQQEAEAVRNIPITDGYEEAVTLIVKHVHELGGNLITSGMGKAGQIAMNIATTFCSTGTPAYFLHPSEAQHGDLRLHFDSPSIRPVSTIGAGDNFNAGILYGLLKNNVRHRDLATLPKETWANIIRCGIDLATEVCRSYDNYISKEFATSYLSQS